MSVKTIVLLISLFLLLLAGAFNACQTQKVAGSKAGVSSTSTSWVLVAPSGRSPIVHPINEFRYLKVAKSFIE
ncbi:MAG: hypothetical protein A2Z20_01650 [Bdellovibrionales bacterium RBG_16_40_8]|nr:MAG: hypothetical protein A2Z20_01650 [Bdellovibrionales bacterium RBG_16_40_8]